MTKILNFALKIKGGGREGGTCEVLRPCHPPKIWNVHKVIRWFGLIGNQNRNRTKGTSFIAMRPHFGCNPEYFDYKRNVPFR